MENIKLTIIIPFLNEKEEVENTVKSIIEYSKENSLEIILIDDASNDGYDYKSISLKYHVRYIKNKERIGVAASRDLGVACSTTPYIMFLDAHMRFYDTMWYYRIIEELSIDEKAILCCQSKGIMEVNNEFIEVKGRPLSFGAYIDFYDDKNLIEPKWIFKEEEYSNDKTIIIPCILGAAYACTKKFWLYLKGLEGLQYYGSDEAYISIKAWLGGGNCKLLKDVFVGHLYRNKAPYDVQTLSRWYNRLLIAELLLPEKEISRIYSYINLIERNSFYLLYKNRELVYSLKKYYKEIFQYKFDYFYKINNAYVPRIVDNSILVEQIAQFVILNCNLLSDDGLLNGKMGIVLFLLHYSEFCKNDIYAKFAYTILDGILERLSYNLSLELESGLTGIGWGIAYLYQNSFLSGDVEAVFEELDNNIISQVRDNLELSTSELISIIYYIMARIYLLKSNNIQKKIPSSFLTILYNKVQLILNEINTYNLGLLINFCMYYEGLTSIRKSSIYDIIYLRLPDAYDYKKFAPGLDGNSGVGLKLILDTFLCQESDN